MDNLLVTSTGTGPSQLGYIGSVMDVIAGKISPALDGKIFDAQNYLYGFELASPHNKYSLGEAIIVNGSCYATSTDKKSPDYGRTIYGPKFTTSGMLLIPHQAKPSYKINLDSKTKPLPLLDFYKQIYDKINRPLAFIGLVTFSNLHATAIGKPPIDGMNIFANKELYYPLPAIVSSNTPAFIFGVLTDYRQNQYEDINKQLEVAVYRTTHPGDTTNSSSLTNHAHVLTLKQSITEISAITPQLADKTLHVFTDNTTITSAQLDVFTINSLDNYQK